MKLHLGLAGLTTALATLGVLEAAGDQADRSDSHPPQAAQGSSNKAANDEQSPARSQSQVRPSSFESRNLPNPDLTELTHSEGHFRMLNPGFPQIGPTARQASNTGTMRYAVFLPDIDSSGIHARPFMSATETVWDIDAARRRYEELKGAQKGPIAPLPPSEPWRPPLILPETDPTTFSHSVELPFR